MMRSKLAPSSTDVVALIQSIVSGFEPAAKKKGVVLQAKTPAQMSRVVLDAAWIESAVTNLVANALKYTDSSRMTSQASFIAYDMMDRIRANSGADYTVTPPTSGNLSVTRDQDLYDFTTNIVRAGLNYRF